jgi:CubicO group peptidase (beta-lactamase class C family)
MNRRTALRQILGTVAAATIVPAMRGVASPPQLNNNRPNYDRPNGGELAAMAAIGRNFMQSFFAPALSVAIVRNSKFVYERGFGIAYRKDTEQCTPTSLFRIASLSMPITSVAIFTLVEQGKVNLSDKVFGPSGILGTAYGKGPYKQYVTDITVDNLLTHTSGGWPSDSTDPMFRFNSWDFNKLISWTIENLPLTYPPGEHWAYSNFGYCVLGRVIEKITGQPYQSYVQQAVLAPCGITDMQIAGNTLKERAPNEVEYLGQFGEKPYDMNVRRMDSDSGWIANPSDLAQFLSHVGGSPTIPSLLKPETIQIMTTPSPAYPQSSPAKYARGWMVADNGKGNWWHSGSMLGSSTIMVKTPTGMAWAALTNTRTQPEAAIDQAIDQLVPSMIQAVPAWNT